jgi:hypothetical protein
MDNDYNEPNYDDHDSEEWWDDFYDSDNGDIYRYWDERVLDELTAISKMITCYHCDYGLVQDDRLVSLGIPSGVYYVLVVTSAKTFVQWDCNMFAMPGKAVLISIEIEKMVYGF